MTRPRQQPRPVLAPVLLTREQAADVAQVSLDRIDDWRHRPGFPVIVDGQLVRIHADEYGAWLRAEALRTNERPTAEVQMSNSSRKATR